MVVGYAGIGFTEDVNIPNDRTFHHMKTGIRILDQSEEGIGAVFSASMSCNPSMWRQKQGSISAISSVPGMSYSTRIGEPQMPVLRPYYVGYRSERQFNARIVSSTTEEILLEDRSIIHPIIPAQPSLSKSEKSR